MRHPRISGHDLPRIVTPPPGPLSRAWVDRLAQRECPAITARRARRAARLGAADTDPPVWIAARGSNVVDADDNVLVDLTAGFGVASVGHAHPHVVAAAQRQVAILPHAMGDAFFDPRRVELLETLHDLTGLDRAILGSSGSDAVEAALKTARVASGKDKIIAFKGGYHGLSYGVLPVSDFMAEHFRAPFEGQLGRHVHHVPFGGPLPSLADVAAVLLEPVQGRGGIIPPPAGWLKHVARQARDAGCLVILDEILTGFGRTGGWFAFQREGLQPDLLCLGKGMAAGFPISACMGTSAVMDAWGASTGQAIHTQTFLGNPVGCAMASATITVLKDQHLPARARRIGRAFAQRLAAIPGVVAVRGSGLMLAAVLDRRFSALAVSRHMLAAGYIILPVGADDDALGFTPPLNIADELLEHAAQTLAKILR